VGPIPLGRATPAEICEAVVDHYRGQNCLEWLLKIRLNRRSIPTRWKKHVQVDPHTQEPVLCVRQTTEPEADCHFRLLVLGRRNIPLQKGVAWCGLTSPQT